MKPKKIKPINPSKPGSNIASGQNSPVINKVPLLDTEELSKKLLDHQHRQAQQQQQQTQQHQQELKTTPSPDICEKFKVGKCPHGVSGKTLHNGHACNKAHPKRCSKFMKRGAKGRYGCKKGDSCKRYHPSHCKSSLANRYCYKEDCTLVHLVGTKRLKQPAKHVPRDDSRQRRSSESASRSYRRPEADGDRRKPSTHNKESPFLEVLSLLKLMQKELQELKSNMASQESKISSMLPNIRQCLPPAPSMPFLPQHQIHQHPQHQFHQHPQHQIHQPLQNQIHQPPPPPIQSSWPQCPVSGC